MATSQTQSFLTEIIEGQPIPVGKLEYFRERLKSRLHQIVLTEFLRREDRNNLTQADLGKRIGKRPDQISRLLGASGNWTLNTVSDLLIGMESELDFQVILVADTTNQIKAASTANKLSSLTSLSPISNSAPIQIGSTSGFSDLANKPAKQI